jgi:hypothetical protein
LLQSKLALMQGKKHILTLFLSTALIANSFASDDSYYDQFLEVSKIQKGFISDVTLVDTNNTGPNLTNAPISYSAFAGNGELSGIRVGMKMSQVVAAWGKPPRFFTFCGLGPRFWYGRSRNFGPVTLAFKENKLAIIGVDLSQMPCVAFDNGFNGTRSDIECEKTLGKPTLRSPRTRGWYFCGDVAYCTNEFRTDLHFNSVTGPQSASELWMISVSSNDAEHRLLVATITNLLNHPQSYDGLRVKVEGYLKAGRELSAFYQNLEDASQSSDDKVWIAPTIRAGHENDVQSIKEGKVRVIGMVDYWLRSLELGVGRSNHWDIEISDLELLEEIKE